MPSTHTLALVVIVLAAAQFVFAFGVSLGGRDGEHPISKWLGYVFLLFTLWLAIQAL